MNMTKEPNDVPRKVFADLELLDAVWKQQKNIKTLAYQLLEKEPLPYSYALDLMFHASDFKRGKGSTLAYAVMLAFSEWAQKKFIDQPLTLELKQRALQIVVQQRNSSLIKLVIRTFRINDEDASYFIEAIGNLLVQEKFNEAACCVSALDLQQEFTLNEIVLPLIFQDKKDLVIEYIKGYPEMQLELVNMLDAVCLQREAIAGLVGTLKMKDIRKCRLDPKWLQKVLWNILKKYDIPLGKCPNLCHLKSRGALKYLMYRKYIEKSMSESSWEELTIDAVQDDLVLQKELLVQLISYDESAAALKMATKLKIPYEEWPETLQVFSEDENRKADNNEEIDNHIQAADYLSLEVNASDIHLIETTEQFVHCFTEVVENYSVVGVDAEWKPSFGVVPERLSLLQLGVSDKVFLIDFISLSSHLQDEHFDMLFNNFLSNSNILKLGYGISTDLKMLMKCYPGKRGKFHHACVLDVGSFYDALQNKYPERFLCAKDGIVEVLNIESARGLSKLCQMVLGKPLRKCEQFSDWEKRPLRSPQILYAALDAHCLLQIYKALCDMMLKMGLSATAAVDDFLNGKWNKPVVKKNTKTKAEKKTLKEKYQPSTSRAMPKISLAIKDFKAVADNMLQGLGRYLRLYGADVVVLENDDEHTDAVKIALAQERIILTNGAPYEQLSRHVPEDMCFYVPETLDANQQAKYVLDSFNIQVTEGDILSRCSLCNGDEFLEIPSERLRFLWLKYSHSVVPCQSEAYLGGGLYDKYCSRMQPGVSIQLENLSPNAFNRVKEFLVCTKCGKVYWEGSHHDRIRNSLSNLIASSEAKQEDQNKESSDDHEQSNVYVSESVQHVISDSPSHCTYRNDTATTSGSAHHDEQKNIEADASDHNCFNYSESHREKPIIMHFDEDSSDEDCNFIIFNS